LSNFVWPKSGTRIASNVNESIAFDIKPGFKSFIRANLFDNRRKYKIKKKGGSFSIPSRIPAWAATEPILVSTRFQVYFVHLATL
jgi:hypothetical protein